MASIEGSRVDVRVTPDTTGFYRTLLQYLKRVEKLAELEVKITADATGLHAEEARIRGSKLSQTVRLEGDASGLREIGRQIERERRQWEAKPITFKYELDDKQVQRTFTNLQGETSRLNSFIRAENHATFNDATQQLARLKTQAGDYAQTERTLIAQRTALVANETAERERLTEAMLAAQRLQANQSAHVVKLKADLKTFQAEARKARKAGDRALVLRYDSTVIPEAKRELAEWQNQLNMTSREARKAQTELNRLFGDKYHKQLDRLDKDLQQTRTGMATVRQSIRELSDTMDATPFTQFRKGIDMVSAGFSKSIELQKQADTVARRTVNSVKQLTEGQQALADSLDEHTLYNALDRFSKKVTESYHRAFGEQLSTEQLLSLKQELSLTEKQYDKLTDAEKRNYRQVKVLTTGRVEAERALEKNKQTTLELTELLDGQKDTLSGLSKAFRDFKPYGIDRNTAEALNNMLDGLEKLRVQAERKPLLVKAKLDTGIWEKQYADLLHDAENLRRELERQHDIDVRVKVWDDQADDLETRLRKLRSTRLDIPVDWQIDQEQIIKRMRDIAAQIKANPERQWELEANLDLQVRKADAQFKKYQDEHDKVEADLDLKTALARAHMMAFTRPRSVEIIARLNTTQAGKILNGIIYGSTGLKGVTNQFDKLVNLFDKLDTMVPRLAVIEGVLGALSAGAVNLSRSVLGVGASVASMSKAAMAAPGALIGLGAAMLVLRNAWGDKGGTFSEQIDLASTKLNGFGDTVNAAFYGKATPAIRSLVNDVSGKLIPNITGIAEAEGAVTAGLADVIRESYRADELPRIFDNSRKAIDSLSPGLQDLIRAFLGLGDATSMYLPKAASYLSDVAAKTSQWVETAKNTGQISLAMAQATEQGGYLKDSLNSLIGIATGLYGSLAVSENGIQGMAETLAKADKAVNSYRFQDTMRAWGEGAQTAQREVRDSFSDIGNAAYELRDVTGGAFADAGSLVAAFTQNLSRILQGSKTGLANLSSGVRDGVVEIMDAMGDATPMFDSLATMVGELARTFGGTFAASLRASAPLIQAVATAATAVSKAFSALPAPVQSAIGLYLTFGRAGKTAFDTVKTAMLENTMKSAQWQKQLSQLGVSMTGMAPSLLDIAAGWGAVRTGMNGAGGEADKTGKAMGKAATRMDKLKLAGSGVASMIAGINPVTIALGAAVGVATVAWSDYTMKAQATETANQNIGSSLQNLKYEIDDTGKIVSSLSQSLQSAFTTENYGQDGWKWVSDMFSNIRPNTQFKTTADAAKQLGINMSDLERMTKANDSTYNRWLKSLNQGDYTLTQNGAILDENGSAYQRIVNDMNKARQSLRDQIRQTAEANGYTSAYIDKLMEGGGATDFMALKAKSAAEQTADYNQATQSMTETLDRERDARINAANAASSYGRTMSTIGETVKQVQSLAEKGQQVWDKQALSFDLSTEAGRTASDTLTSLASSANNVIDTMIASGASYDQVADKQRQLQADLHTTGDQLTNNATGVHQYTDSLLATPNEIRTKIELQAEQSKLALLQYTSMIEKLFPEGTQGQAVYDMILRMEDNGAITSFEQVNAEKDKMLAGLKNGTMGIVIDANGTEAVATLETINRLGGELGDDGKYHVTVNADDLATPKISGLLETIDRAGLDDKQIKMFLNAEGNANMQVDDLRYALQQLGVSNKDIEILLNSKGNAPDVMKLVEQKLKDLGATDKQIDWFLDAIDQTAKGTTSAQARLDSVRQTAAAAINAVDETKAQTMAAQANIDGVKQGDPAALKALNLTGDQVKAAQALIDTVKQRNPAMLNAIDNTHNPVWSALASIAQIPPDKWTDLYAKDLASSVISLVQSMKIDNKDFYIRGHYFTVDENGTPVGTLRGPRAATGGRIIGPGSGTSDSIPAWLSNGEHVIRAAAVKKLDSLYGKGFLDYMNRVGELPKQYPVTGRSASFNDQRRAFAAGGRAINDVNGRLNMTVNPIVTVNIPESNGMQVTQNFNTRIIRSDDDMYTAASIYFNAAMREARLIGANHGR